MKASLITSLFFLLGLVSWTSLEAQLPDTFQLNIFEYHENRQESAPGVKTRHFDSATLNRQGYQNLGSLLSSNTPVFIKSYGAGGLSTPSFRGTGASHTQLAWNGIPVNSPMNGVTDLSLYPVTLMDGLSIGYGSSSIAQRPGGLGGRINMQNQPDWQEKYQLRLEQHAGSFGNYQTFLKGTFGTDHWQNQTQIYFRSAENDFKYPNLARRGEPEETEENAAYEQYGVMEEFYIKASEQDFISVNTWFQEMHRELPTPVNVSEKNQEQSDKNLRSVVKWRHYWEDGSLKVQSGFVTQDLNFQDPSVNINANHQAWSSLNSVNVKQKIGQKGMLNTGIIYDHQWAESDGYVNTKRQEQTSFYVSYSREFSSSLQVYGRLQQELVDRSRAPILPSLGITFKPLTQNRLFLKGNVSRNYEVPSLNDLYWENGGNPDLKPEKGWNQEVGIGYEWSEIPGMVSHFHWEITGYRGVYDNWILWAPNKSGNWEAENIQKVLSRGIESSVKTGAKLGTWQLKAGLNYSYTESKNLKGTQNLDASEGKQLIYIPFHKGTLNGGVYYEGYQFHYQQQLTGKRFVTRDHGNWLNPYSVANMSLSKTFRLGRFSINGQFRVENLYDTYYESLAWRPMPGRSYHLKIALQYE